MKTLTIRVGLILLMSATIGCDRVTKHIAATTIAGTAGRSFLADTVRLQYAENPGAFLSLGEDWPPRVRTALFGVGNGLLLTGLAIMAVRRRWPTSTLLGVAFLVAGGASNLVDHVTYGKVIDFMNVGVGPVRTGIFNLADMAIMLGAGIIAVSAYYREARDTSAT